MNKSVNEILELLKNRFKYIQSENDLSEEKIKIDIVRDIFLKEMGYDILKVTYEDNISNGVTDMRVNVGNDILTVETKAGNHIISYKDIEQLIRYLNTQGREWGILTNGKEYLLLNAKIQTEVSNENKAHMSNIVFWFDIFIAKKKNMTNIRFFTYMSKNNIFDEKTTYFFKDISQFKSYSFMENEENWDVYKSTLSNFFDYYVNELGKKYKERALEKITIEDFENFIEYKKMRSKNNILSDQTIKNNWSHINSLFLTFKSKGRISYNPFGEGRNASLGILASSKRKNVNNLNDYNVHKIIDFFASRANPARNIAIFLLCSVMGFERADIINLEWKHIDLENRTINQGLRKLNYCNLLSDCLIIMHKEKIKGKNKLENVFCTCKNGKYNKFRADTINDIFDRLQNIDNSNIWKDFSPKYVKNCSIELYFECGYTLDEIIYWTGSDLDKVSEFLNSKKIYERVEMSKGEIKKNKIFGDMLDTSLQEWIKK